MLQAIKILDVQISYFCFVNISATRMSFKQIYSNPKLPTRFLFTVSRQHRVIHIVIPRRSQNLKVKPIQYRVRQTVRICYPWHFRYNFPLKTPGHWAWVLQLKRPWVGFLWSIAFLPHQWCHMLRKQPLTGRFWAAMLKAHNSKPNNSFEWEERQRSTKKMSNIYVPVWSINLKNGYFLLQFSFKFKCLSKCWGMIV